MAKDNLDAVLADLKRQRDDLERRIRALEESRGDTTDIIDRLKRLRDRTEQSQKIGADDATLRVRR